MSSMYSLTLSKALGRSRSNKTWRKANGEPARYEPPTDKLG